jgi:protein gp37
MAENTSIEWADDTFNPWRGCHKVSDGCLNCYAERKSKRIPRVFGKWGKDAARVIASENFWRQPIKWNREAESAMVRRRVFCASLADIFETRADLVKPRVRLFELIGKTPWLDWMILTKRPENICKCLPADWGDGWPNVWLGASVENRKHGVPRIAILREVPATIRFLSCEPLLEDLGALDLREIDWVIVGGESGFSPLSPRFRRMDHDWARAIRDQCRKQNVPFFFKQSAARYPKQGRELDGQIIQEFPLRRRSTDV